MKFISGRRSEVSAMFDATGHRNLLRMVRPSLLDPRFNGDHWIGEASDDTFVLYLGEYRLAQVRGVEIDRMSMNQVLDRIRHRRRRRRA